MKLTLQTIQQEASDIFSSDFGTWLTLPTGAGVLFFFRRIILREIVRLLGIRAKRCLQPNQR